MLGERYHLFRLCAETCSFTEAAERAFRTQPAVSQSMAILEAELEVILFHREGRRLRLTDAGLLLQRYCTEAEERERSLRTDLENLRNLASGNVHLGATPTTACYWLPDPLRRFRTDYPGIQLHLRTGSGGELVRWLTDGDLDVALVTLPVEDPAVVLQPLLDREDVLICAAGSKLLPALPPRLQDLEGVPFILPDAATRTRTFLDELFRVSNLRPRVALEVQGLEVIKRYVGMDFGVSIVPRMAVELEVARGELECWTLVPQSQPRTLALARPARRSLSRAAKVLVNLLEAWSVPEPISAGFGRG